ncbi:unnamed protein product [Ectocarpus sp. 12 AP-2014]
MKGYVTSAEDPILERLMEILRYFDDWNDMLQEFPPPTGGGDLGWKKHFITRESWFDLRLTILGFVATCRYFFEHPEGFGVDDLSSNANRFINPRTFSQDILEHRFAHIRAGLGTLRNPTAAQAKERSVRGDLNRGLHGGSRANFNRNARSGDDFNVSDYRGRIMLAVTQAEAAENARARSRNSPNAVLCPRYISVEPLAATPVVETSVPAAQASSTIVNPYASSK